MKPSGIRHLDKEAQATYKNTETMYNKNEPPFDYISLADVRGLMWYESYFDQGGKSNT